MVASRSRRFDPRFVCLFVLLSIPAIVVPACASGNNSSTSGALGGGGSGASTGANAGGGGQGQGGHGNGGGIVKPDAGCDKSCTGVCLPDGSCCADPTDVCGSACCAHGTVCLFDQCVTPGKQCHTNKDCNAGQYCETGLGNDMDAGTDAGPMDAGCTQPPPLPGRCLDRPPVCQDGGTPDGGCIADCEYHPQVGNLNAVERWHWDDTNAETLPGYTDVWATPAIGRVFDSNCDGKIDELDPPNVIFVSGNATNVNGVGSSCFQTDRGADMCSAGVLRMLDGRTGKEIWSLDNPAGTTPDGGPASGQGFAGLSVAIGDIDGDGRMDIIAATGDGHLVMVDGTGHVLRTSDTTIVGINGGSFGWGGGIAIGDMDGDGSPEIAYGPTVYSTKNNAITQLWKGTAGNGGGGTERVLSTMVDLDGDGKLELLAGCSAYKFDGTFLWNRCSAGPSGPALTDGFSGVGDFDGDGKPDAVLVTKGNVYILDGVTGATKFGPVGLAGGGDGGPPTVADFDGDGKPEIGVAQENFYYMLKPRLGTNIIDIGWSVANHDFSSSITGSSVFDFEGDGKAEVIYADECFLWVFDGATGAVRFAAPHTSFTATEASLVADVDGDGHAEMLMVSNAADPSDSGWKCLNPDGTPQTINGVTWAPGPYQGGAYRGLRLFGDQASSWVGTRTLWNEHTYHVSNICDDRDTACPPPNVYGSIPAQETPNWSLMWLNNFRQNVQDQGIFDAPDATVSLTIDCTTPVIAHASVRNIGLASLPSTVSVGVYRKVSGMFTQLVGQADTTHQLFPGQTQTIDIALAAPSSSTDEFVARIIPATPLTFHECRTDNDESAPTKAKCIH